MSLIFLLKRFVPFCLGRVGPDVATAGFGGAEHVGRAFMGDKELLVREEGVGARHVAGRIFGGAARVAAA